MNAPAPTRAEEAREAGQVAYDEAAPITAEELEFARRLWREREMRFPAFVRRMTPDALDYATGAWWRTVVQARANLAGGADG